MPEDLKYIINQSQLTDIGDAIRSKLGEQDTYTVDEMPEKISEIGGSTKIVYIPEQTVTTQRYGRDTFYAVLNGVNIDLNNPPSTFTLKVDNDEYEMEKYNSGSAQISYRSNGYYIFYDSDYATGSWVISDSQAIDYATFTVYAEGDSGGSGGSDLLKLALTFKNQDADHNPINLDDFFPVREDGFSYNLMLEVPTGGTPLMIPRVAMTTYGGTAIEYGEEMTLNFYYAQYLTQIPGLENIFAIMINKTGFSVSDFVNCSSEPGEGFYGVLITDYTENSSFTATYHGSVV